MARCLRSFFRLSLSSSNKTVTQNVFSSGRRFLYTDQHLGINGYIRTQKFFQNQFYNVEGTFREKMKDICEDENSMIFTEDLKAMLHLLEKKPEDLELITKMLRKFSKQNKEIRFSTYIFGPIIMRTFYVLNEPDVALSVVNDPEMGSLFDQLISYQVLMCLMYKNQRYVEVRQIYDKVQEKAIYGKVHPRQLQQLAMAACYKENTPEAFEYATRVYRDSLDKGADLLRRSIVFLAVLAINQNAPHIALEVLSTLSKSNFMDARCIRIMACMDLGRFFEIIPILRESLERYQPNMRKELYFVDVIERLEEHLKKNEIPESEDLLKLVYQLKLNNHVTEKTLGQYLDQPVESLPRRPEGIPNQGSTFTRRTGYTQERSNLRDLL